MQEVINAVVIDDDIGDIVGITTALSQYGISSLPIHYRDPTDALQSCTDVAVAHPRIIITDIQLRDGGVDPTTADLSAVAACLGCIVAQTRGPYVVLAWTTKPKALDELKTRITEYFGKKKYRLPMYFDGLYKNECRTDDNEYDASVILKSFQSHLECEAATRALMHWECSVLKAATESVNTISVLDAETLPQSLKMLAESVAGSNLKGFEAMAINEAFAYIVRDKLALLSLNPTFSNRWRAVFDVAIGEIPELSKHQINSMLHIEGNLIQDVICPGDVWKIDRPSKAFLRNLEVPSECNNLLDKIKNEFLTLSSEGHDLNLLMRQESHEENKQALTKKYNDQFAVPLKLAKNAASIVMIEISPACDFANKKKPLNTVALGILMDLAHVKNGVVIKETPSTVKVKIMHEDKEQLLGFSAKYITSMSEKLIGNAQMNLTKVTRVRESLLQSWIHRFASYNSRIGTITLS